MKPNGADSSFLYPLRLGCDLSIFAKKRSISAQQFKAVLHGSTYDNDFPRNTVSWKVDPPNIEFGNVLRVFELVSKTRYGVVTKTRYGVARKIDDASRPV